MPDFSRRFILQTDASPVALGAVLLQDTPEGRWAISYASRTLTSQERKYSVFELEALAVLFGIEKFRMYIEHVHFDLETDCQALSWVLAKPRTTGRIARWAVRLSAFKFTVTHIRGADNTVADALSRMFAEESVPAEDEQHEPSPVTYAVFPSETSSATLISGILTELPLAFQSLRQHQLKDESLVQKISLLEDKQPVPGFLLKNGVLHSLVGRSQSLRIVLPPTLVDMVFHFFHESPIGGHLGVFKTRDKIRQYFVWCGMDTDIRVRVKTCRVCAEAKPAQRTNYGLLSSEIPRAPLDRLVIDYVGKFPRSRDGNQYVLVVVDAFTKFVWLTPVREATSRTTIGALKRIFAVVGFPRTLVSDNASYFVSHQFRNFCFDLGIKHFTTSPYHPQASVAERFNKNLRSALIAYHSADHRSWDQNLFWLSFAFNCARHEAHRQTPVSLVFGFPVNNPLSNVWNIKDLLPDARNTGEIKGVWRRAAANLKIAHERRRSRYNKGRKSVPYKVGDQVLLKTFPQSKAAFIQKATGNVNATATQRKLELLKRELLVSSRQFTRVFIL